MHDLVRDLLVHQFYETEHHAHQSEPSLPLAEPAGGAQTTRPSQAFSQRVSFSFPVSAFAISSSTSPMMRRIATRAPSGW